MKYFSRLGIYKNSNGNNQFDPETKQAYSYRWWLYCTIYKGKVIFNDTTYSSSTCKHQSATLDLLDYKVDITLNHTTKSLSNVTEALNDEIKNCRGEILQLKAFISKPRTRKSTNERRELKIKQLDKHIKDVIQLLNE